MNKNDAFLMLDVGGTFIKSGVMNRLGELCPNSEFTAPASSDGSKEVILETLSSVLRRGYAFVKTNGMQVAGVGVAIPGPFDYAVGVSLMTHKFGNINGVSLKEIVREVLMLGEGVPVAFLSDVNAALIGEQFCGNAKGFSNAVVITLGTGLGFAMCRDGAIQCSVTGSPKFSIYNSPFRGSILEDYVSKRGFIRVYEEISGHMADADLTVAKIGEMCGRGDAVALKTFETVGGIIANSVKELLAEQQMECLLLGGQISRSFAFMEGALNEGLKDVSTLKRIAPVKYIGEAALYGLFKILNKSVVVD